MLLRLRYLNKKRFRFAKFREFSKKCFVKTLKPVANRELLDVTRDMGQGIQEWTK